MDAKEAVDRVFRDPKIKYELTEFENLGKPIHEALEIYPKVIESGRYAGKTKYFVKGIVPSSSGKDEFQIYSEGKKSNPEEIVRQLWIYKLINVYGYHIDEIDSNYSALENFRSGLSLCISKQYRWSITGGNASKGGLRSTRIVSP